MEIKLSPDNVSKVKASYVGGKFSFEVKHFTLKEQEAFNQLIKDSIQNEDSLEKFVKDRWNFSILNCTLKNALEVLAYVDIKDILNLVIKVNAGVAEKES